MNYEVAYSHGENNDKKALSIKSTSKQRYVASVAPIIWDDGEKQYLVTEEPIKAGDMRKIYFIDLNDL